MCLRKEIDTVCHLSHITCSLRRSQHTSPCGTPHTYMHSHKPAPKLWVLLSNFSLPPQPLSWCLSFSRCHVFVDSFRCMSAGVVHLCVCVREREDFGWLLKAELWIFHDVWCSDMREREREVRSNRRGWKQTKRTMSKGGRLVLGSPSCYPPFTKDECCHNWFDADAVSCAPYLILLWCHDI